MRRDAVKLAHRDQRRAARKADREQRRIERRCFWTRPFRHAFIEVETREGMIPDLVCVSCGKTQHQAVGHHGHHQTATGGR